MSEDGYNGMLIYAGKRVQRARSWENKYQSQRNLWTSHDDQGRDNVTTLRQETTGDLPRNDQNFVPQRFSGMGRR